MNTKLFKILIVALLVSLIGFVGPALLVKAAVALTAAVGVDRDKVVAGDVVTTTLELKNDGDVTLNDIIVLPTLPSQITFKPGTAKIIEGNNTYPIADNWVTTQPNMGKLIPGEQIKFVFESVVNNSAVSGSTFQIILQAKSNEMSEWLSRSDTLSVMSPDQRANFQTGDIFQAFNNTNGGANWTDPVSAIMGNVIEYKFRIVNKGQWPARNTTVHVQLAWDPNNLSNHLVSKATVDADNADPVVDTATVNVTNGMSHLWPRDGHYNFVGVSDLFKCPNGCPVTRTFMDGPVVIGEIPAGGSFEVQFKADVVSFAPTPTKTPTPTPTKTVTPTPTVTVTPTPTPTTSVTPTPTPTTSVTPTVTPTPTVTVTPTPTMTGTPNECGGTCGSNSNCQGGLFCFEGFCRNPNIVVDGKYVCSTTITPTPTKPQVLGAVAPVAPKTGAGLAELTLGLLGTGAVGFILRRLAHNIW